jgi:parallel beta-helix repeat protein
MDKKPLIGIFICMLLIVSTIIPVSATTSSEKTSQPLTMGNTLYVGGSGPNNYTKIQDAIDNASDGDTIFVFSGSYEAININKQLFIKGIKINEQNNPVINAGYAYSAVTINNDSCTFENFTVMNGNIGGGQGAIRISSNNNIIQHCAIEHTGTGIYCSSSHNNLIYDNEIKRIGNGWEGITFSSSSHNSVINNYIHDHYRREIWFEDNSTYNWCYHNIIVHGTQGIRIEESPFNIIEENNISGSTEGVHIVSSKNTSVLRNSFIGNGIQVSGTFQELSSNIIDANLVDGKPLFYYLNEEGITVPDDAGQVILVNCSHFTINNFHFSGGQRGILLFYSSNNSIMNNTILSVNAYDILLVCSHDNIISGNIIHGGWGGITLSSSNRNIVRDNIISDEPEPLMSGIYASNSSNNILDSNIVYNCRRGINVPSGSYQNNISYNTIENCSIDLLIESSKSSNNVFFYNNIFDGEQGIRVEGGGGYTFFGNNITNCESGFGLIFTENNTISQNSIQKNNVGLSISTCQNVDITYNTIDNNLNGIVVSLSKEIKIKNNNIFNNLKNAEFTIYGFFAWPAAKITWDGNYWGITLLRHKIIFGFLQTAFGFPANPFETVYLAIPWINIDSNPADEPNDIPGMR